LNLCDRLQNLRRKNKKKSEVIMAVDYIYIYIYIYIGTSLSLYTAPHHRMLYYEYSNVSIIFF
jgi:hypothetical protein